MLLCLSLCIQTRHQITCVIKDGDTKHASFKPSYSQDATTGLKDPTHCFSEKHPHNNTDANLGFGNRKVFVGISPGLAPLNLSVHRQVLYNINSKHTPALEHRLAISKACSDLVRNKITATKAKYRNHFLPFQPLTVIKRILLPIIPSWHQVVASISMRHNPLRPTILSPLLRLDRRR